MDWDAVAMQSNSNSSLMACGEHEFYYATDLTGITIRSSKSYIGSLTDNQAKIFSLRGSLTDTLGTHFVQTKFASFAPFIIENNLELVFNRPPSSLDTFQFTFQFFDSDDNIFETSTEPFIVTP